MTRALLFVFCALWCGVASASPDDVAKFYRGRQLQIRIGAGPGSGYDIAGRLVAPYLAKYLPGRPSVVVQNEPGASGLNLTNELSNALPKDGTVLAVVINGIPTAPLLTPQNARFDVSRLNWIGSPSPETDVIMVNRNASVQTYDDLFKKELVVGAVAPGAAIEDMPRVTNAVAGTHFKIISGYETSGAIELAMRRGELQGEAAIGWISVKTRDQKWLDDGDFKIVAQFGLEKNPDLPNVPLFELPKDKVGRQALMLMLVRQEFGRPFVAPPGVPPERLAALRRAFDRAMKDPEFLAAAQKAQLEVHPETGERLQDLARQVAATDPEVVTKMRSILEPGASQRSR